MNIGMIPARIGSNRLAKKNLALLNNKPLIAHTIEAAINARTFDRIIVNSDHLVFEKIANHYGVEFYLRPKLLGSSEAKVDDVVLDFIEKYNPSILAWVNPTSPLQTGEEIAGAIRFFVENHFDSLVTVKDHKVHCVYNEVPINFSRDELFGQTQHLFPVQSFVYSVCAWRASIFKMSYATKGWGFFCGRTGYYPVSFESSLLIKTIHDLKVADYILRSRDAQNLFKLDYYSP